MRAELVRLAGIASLAAAGMACTDLFHPTSDIRSACELNPAASACEGSLRDGGDGEAPIDFCVWTSAQARSVAVHACAWLGACGTDAGSAFGSCVWRALLAYDCNANPSHKSKGVDHDGWACLATAKSCAAVDGCMANGGPVVSSVATSCGGEPPSSCAGGALLCDDGGVALDCTGSGAQRCSGYPLASSAAWVACLPEDAGLGGECAPSDLATCSGGASFSCPAGVREMIDCSTLLGLSNACQPGTLSPPFDWTSPCGATQPQCVVDSCGDGVDAPTTSMVGCLRGAAVPIDCAQENLGPCQGRDASPGAEPACSPRP